MVDEVVGTAEPVVVVETDAANTAQEGQEAAQGSEGASEASEAAGEGSEGAAEAQEAQAEPEKKPRNPVAQLQGRVGHLTKQIHAKDAALEGAQREIEAYKALLNNGNQGQEAPAVAADATPHPGTVEFDRLVDERASQKAQIAAFNTACNAIFEEGVQKHGDAAFKEATANLNTMGYMGQPLLDAAMASDAPADVLHALGSDLDEAERILNLPPVRMVAEIAKLGSKLAAAPKPKAQFSNAPAPITPLGGQVKGSENIYNPKLSDDEYIRLRQAQGAVHARPPRH